MKYVFIDTDNGVTTPTNDTPDTSTSKYHTSWDGVTWPASTARWLQANSAAANATITALTDDVTFVARGATDNSPVTLSNSLQAASIVFVGDATGPVWDSSKYTILADGASSQGLRVQRQANVTAKNVQVVCNSSATNTRCVLIDPVSGTSTYTIDGFKLKQGGTGAGGVAVRSSVNIGVTVNVLNTIAVNDNATTTPSGFGFTAGNIVNVYNCVVTGFVNGINTADTVKNCAVYDNTDDFVTCTTVAYCASDDGDGTNAVTGLTWANQFVDYANGNFALKSGSSLIGAGIGPSSDANVPSTDIAGVTRSGTTTDIGAAMFVATGLTITSVNTTNTAFSAQTNSAVIGTGLSASVVCTYAGIACTNESASSSTSLKITFPNFFTNNIKLGRNYEFKVVG